MKQILVAMIAGLVLWPTPSMACSVGSDYRIPDTLGLIRRADAIVIADVIAEEGADDPYRAEVVFRPVSLIMGETLPGDLRLAGNLSRDGYPAAANDPEELAEPNPDALTGGCRRYVFDRGTKVILFLQRESGAMKIATYPSARSIENVVDDSSPWAVAVRMYVAIASIPEDRQCAALIKRRDSLRAETSDRLSQLLARDIERHIVGMEGACPG